MNQFSNDRWRSLAKFLRTPWGIATVIMIAFFLGEGYLALRDRPLEAALNNDPGFASPAFDLSFSKHISYDPLTFVGKGAQAGYWKWTPEALVLTDKGREYFDESGDRFVSHVAAGKRRIKRIRTDKAVGRERRLEFLYEWTEVSPPAALMLVPPPRIGDDYSGQAVMTLENGNWKVKSLRTPDFDDRMAHLRDIGNQVRR